MTARNFDELKDFFSGYFHEDWVLEAEVPDQIISSYLACGRSSKDLRELAGQMLRFADAYSDDVALEQALFSELGCYYLPSVDKISAREWLQHVASILLEAAERAP
jgi:hypothetical protein